VRDEGLVGGAEVIGEFVERLVKAGCDPVTAAEVVTECFSFGIAAAPVHPNPPDSAAEKRRYWDREYRRRKRECPPESTRIHPNSETSYILKEDSKKDSKRRGSRISAEWLPTSEGHSFALQEGFSVSEIDREVQKFRDYWVARPGAGGLKLDWDATWRQWIRKGAESTGKTPTSAANGSHPDAGVDWDKTASLYASTGHWSKWAGPDPDHPQCRCPRDVLQKHGIEVHHD
jgi:hypothetical protein